MITTDDIFSYIESFTNLERTPGVSMRPYRPDRMAKLLELFGNPHLSVRVIHIAGSKGKGSTGAYISKVLDEAGLTTGLYTSPHVSSYKERITLAGSEIDDQAFIDAFADIRKRIPDNTVPGLPGKESPTTFELLTVLAFLVFRKIGCSWAVIETGIGGRLDATNLVAPDHTVITPIELEHTELLGDTIEKIAAEKAGIIKEGVPAYITKLHPAARDVIRSRCVDVNAPLIALDEELVTAKTICRFPVHRVEYTWRDGSVEEYVLGMNGDVQRENAALAILVCKDVLESMGSTRTETIDIIQRGLSKAVLSGRMEILSTEPVIVLDGAHTPSSIEKLVDSFCEIYPEPRRLVFGSVSGKKHAEMASILAPHFERVVVSTPGTFKTSDPEAVWQSFCRHHENALLEKDPACALDAAKQDGEPSAILVTGSFYMISQIRALVAPNDTSG